MIVEHSEYIDTVTCSDSGFVFTLNDTDAFTYLENEWESNFLIVTHQDGCGVVETPGERTFWLVSGVEFDQSTMTVNATATQQAMEDSLNTATISWGKYSPATSKCPPCTVCLSHLG